MKVLKAVEDVNEKQKSILFDKLSEHFNGQLTGKTIAVWGLSFKPETDDMREAPSLVTIEKLLQAGCKVNVYDPVAMDEAKKKLGDSVVYGKDIYEISTNANAVLMLTEWKAFRIINWEKLKEIMKETVVVDGRNIYDKKELAESGFVYYSI